MGAERRMMVGRGPDGLPKVMEVDADGYLEGVAELIEKLVTDPLYSREKIYPWNAPGVAVSAGALNTWGDPAVLVPIDGITTGYGYDPPMPQGCITPYKLVGVWLRSTANPTVTCAWNIFRIIKGIETILNADSGLGQVNPDRVYIADTSYYELYDLVWISDDNTPDGEMRRVDGIVANAYLDLDANLNNAYTIAQNAKVYVVRRDGSRDLSVNWGKQRAAGINASRRIAFYAPKQYAAGDGILAGARDLQNSATPNVMSMTIIFDSEKVC